MSQTVDQSSCWWVSPDLHVKSLPDAGMWELTRRLVFQYGKKKYYVPMGFQTDLASIPKIFRVFFSVNGRHRRAAVLHDNLYSLKLTTRKECDKIFYRAMIAGGLGKVRAKMMYAAVRAGGWAYSKGEWPK